MIEIYELGESYLVNFEIYNQGEMTAASVTIEGQLIENGSVVEISTGTIAYVQGESSRAGGLYFSHNPQNASLQL